MQQIGKAKPDLQRMIDRKNLKPDKEEMEVLEKVEAMLNEKKPVRDG